MARVICPKCNEPLDEIIRKIEVRCRFDEEADDYLMQEDEGYSDLCPTCRTELEDV
jgi:RNase P subunit RPR2